MNEAIANFNTDRHFHSSRVVAVHLASQVQKLEVFSVLGGSKAISREPMRTLYYKKRTNHKARVPTTICKDQWELELIRRGPIRALYSCTTELSRNIPLYLFLHTRVRVLLCVYLIWLEGRGSPTRRLLQRCFRNRVLTCLVNSVCFAPTHVLHTVYAYV